MQPPILHAIKSVINKEKERSQRKLNLIIHDIVESDAETSEICKQENLKQVKDIFNKQLDIQTNISNIIRWLKGGPKPRLLKVTVDSESVNAAILWNSKKL